MFYFNPSGCSDCDVNLEDTRTPTYLGTRLFSAWPDTWNR
jgi:hypothetical protein